MHLATEVMRSEVLTRRAAPAVRTTHVEWTNRPGTSSRLQLERPGDFFPVANDTGRRFRTLCRLNRPAAILVVSMTADTVRLDALYPPSEARRLEGMLALAVHMDDKPLANVSSRAFLGERPIRTFLSDLPPGDELAFIIIDKSGFHRSGRRDLFAEALHLFCNRKEFA